MDKPLDVTDLTKLRAGDEHAVRQWFERYADPLYTLVYYRLGGDAGMAEDVVQETFLRALVKIEDYEPTRGPMFAWLSYLSKNCIKKMLRDNSRTVAYQLDDAALDAKLADAYLQIDKQLLPQDILERVETADLVRIALGSIAPHYATVLRQRYYEKATAEQISKSLGSSAGAVRTLLYRARAAFKEAFLQLAKSAGETRLERNTK
ncbi:MAG TPA: RNA polymerase sigma factor [Sedimentisphaerales bacterium]|nr:RNA polymerase sigma factor [Sedimentisphaerales bacterium]